MGLQLAFVTVEGTMAVSSRLVPPEQCGPGPSVLWTELDLLDSKVGWITP